MVVFYVILVVVLTITLVLCIAKIISGLNEVYDEYRHVIEEIVSMESKIEHIMKSNVAQSEWIHTCTDCLKELSKYDSRTLESLTNIKSLINGYHEDNIIKFDNLSSKQKKFNESITELITTNSHAIVETNKSNFEALCDTISSNATIIAESNKATLADFVATVAKSKSDKKTTRAKTAKA